MDDGAEEFERLTRELRLRMSERGVIGSVLGYALGWNHTDGDPPFTDRLLRWQRLWERLGRPYCDALPPERG